MDWKIILIVAAVGLGFYAWQRTALVSKAEARQLLAAGALVIDVRSPEEFRAGRVADALNVPLPELRTRLPQLVRDPNQVLLLHCLSGGRSAIARQQARGLGYARAFNLGSLSRARALVQSARPGE